MFRQESVVSQVVVGRGTASTKVPRIATSLVRNAVTTCSSPAPPRQNSTNMKISATLAAADWIAALGTLQSRLVRFELK
jgi:hypothetical protein